MCTSICIIFLLKSWTVIVLATLKSVLRQSYCSLELKNFLRVLHPLKFLLWSQNTTRAPSSIEACYAHFSTNHIHSKDHVWYLHIGHPIEENQQSVTIFLKKEANFKNEWRNCSITNEGKMAKDEWEYDESDFLWALYSVYKKLGQFFFLTLPTNLFNPTRPGGSLVGPRLTFVVYIPRMKNVEALRLNDFS